MKHKYISSQEISHKKHKLNILYSKMGTGKTSLIKKEHNNNHTMVLVPFKSAKQDYVSEGMYCEYFSSILLDIINITKKGKILKKIKIYIKQLKKQGIKTIVMDEIDFSYIQFQTQKYVINDIYTKKDIYTDKKTIKQEYIRASTVFSLFILKALKSKITFYGYTASKLIIPESVNITLQKLGYKKLDKYIISKVSKANAGIQFKTFISMYGYKKNGKLKVSTINSLLKKHSNIIIQSIKYSENEIKTITTLCELANLRILTIVRAARLEMISKNKKLRTLVSIYEKYGFTTEHLANKKLVITDDVNDVGKEFNDEMFNHYDVVIINTNLSRQISLINKYKDPAVINLVKYGGSTNDIQTPGRFRKSYPFVYNILNKKTLKISKFNKKIQKLDLFFNDYINRNYCFYVVNNKANLDIVKFGITKNIKARLTQYNNAGFNTGYKTKLVYLLKNLTVAEARIIELFCKRYLTIEYANEYTSIKNLEILALLSKYDPIKKDYSVFFKYKKKKKRYNGTTTKKIKQFIYNHKEEIIKILSTYKNYIAIEKIQQLFTNTKYGTLSLLGMYQQLVKAKKEGLLPSEVVITMKGKAIGKSVGKNNQLTLQKEKDCINWIHKHKYPSMRQAFKNYRIDYPKGISWVKFTKIYKQEIKS